MIEKKGNIFQIISKEKYNDQNNLSIDWSIFDKIYCIHYLPYTERLENSKIEFKRVNLLTQPNFEIIENVPNKYYNAILDNNRYSENIDYIRINDKNINLQINRLNLIKKISMQQYNKYILIIEDDIRFLKDISKISLTLQNIPLNYDIINMDPYFYNQQKFIEIRNDKTSKINNYFHDVKDIDKVFNMSCVALSTTGAKYLVKCVENYLRPMDNYLIRKKEIDGYESIKTAVINYNICVQKNYEIRQNYHCFDKYTNAGINLKDYNL